MSDTKVITGKVRFSYCHIFKPSSMDDSNEPKYSVSIIIPKSDKAMIAKIETAVKAATEQGRAEKFGGKIPANLKTPLRDGDLERPEDEAYSNSLFINCTSTRKPQIVDRDVQEILDPSGVESGDYGRVSINFYPFSVNGNRGIAAGLNNVQLLEKGEPLSGASSAAEDFATEYEDLV